MDEDEDEEEDEEQERAWVFGSCGGCKNRESEGRSEGERERGKERECTHLEPPTPPTLALFISLFIGILLLFAFSSLPARCVSSN